MEKSERVPGRRAERSPGVTPAAGKGPRNCCACSKNCIKKLFGALDAARGQLRAGRGHEQISQRYPKGLLVVPHCAQACAPREAPSRCLRLLSLLCRTAAGS